MRGLTWTVRSCAAADSGRDKEHTSVVKVDIWRASVVDPTLWGNLLVTDRLLAWGVRSGWRIIVCLGD